MILNIKELIRERVNEILEDSEIEIRNISDDDHLHLTVRSKEFRDKTILQQHRIVFSVLSDIIGHKVHALKLTTVVL